MPRAARYILPGFPHHVTQRGNRRQQTFFSDGDYQLYLDLLRQGCQRYAVACWAWCLMPNHVHLVLEPPDEAALAALLKQVHQAYTRRINAREKWTGCLWQGRFASCAMDEAHALAAVRYVELNPVRARLCARAEDWPWSSAEAHVNGRPEPMLAEVPFLKRIADWRRYLAEGLDAQTEARIGYFTGTGFPLGAETWIAGLERKAGRSLRPRPVGRPESRDERAQGV
jgi:putative transposase